MAFSELELKRCEKIMAQYLERRRPPAHLRDQLDLSCRITGQSVELFEIRPDWQDRTIKRESPVAKATYVQTKKLWKIFWMRQDLKWHGYQPKPEVKNLETFLNVVDGDKHGCFFG